MFAVLKSAYTQLIGFLHSVLDRTKNPINDVRRIVHELSEQIRVIGGLLLVMALAAGILTQSMTGTLLAFPAVILFNTGEILSSLGGIELPTEDVEAPLITPIVKEWVVANY